MKVTIVFLYKPRSNTANVIQANKAGKVETSGESPSFVREDEKLNWQKKNIFFVPVLDTARKTVLLESSLTIK